MVCTRAVPATAAPYEFVILPVLSSSRVRLDAAPPPFTLAEVLFGFFWIQTLFWNWANLRLIASGLFI